MITDADLLQVNATVITGILIFLTIARYHRSTPERRGRPEPGVQWSNVLAVVLSTLGLFLASVAGILFIDTFYELFGRFLGVTEVKNDLLNVKIFFFLGLCGIVGLVYILMKELMEIES